MIRLIIFDFDDTITDNFMLDFKSFYLTCKKFGIKLPAKNKILKFRRKGLLANDISKHLVGNSKKIDLDSFITYRKRFLEDNSVKYLKLKSNIKKLFGFIKTKEMKIVICSANKHKSIIEDFLKINKIFHNFSKILTMDDLGFTIDNSSFSNRVLIKKSLLHNLLKKFSISTSEIVFVGNSLEDLQSANYFEIPFIRFQNNYLPLQKKKNICTVNSMIELRQTIGNL